MQTNLEPHKTIKVIYSSFGYLITQFSQLITQLHNSSLITQIPLSLKYPETSVWFKNPISSLTFLTQLFSKIVEPTHWHYTVIHWQLPASSILHITQWFILSHHNTHSSKVLSSPPTSSHVQISKVLFFVLIFFPFSISQYPFKAPLSISLSFFNFPIPICRKQRDPSPH